MTAIYKLRNELGTMIKRNYEFTREVLSYGINISRKKRKKYVQI